MTKSKLRTAGVVITRSKEGNEEFALKLRRAGFDPIPVDTISLEPPRDWNAVDAYLRSLGSFDWVVFTSPTGARYFGTRMKELNLRIPWEGKPKVATVGQQTSRALSEIGVRTDFTPSEFTTGILGEELPWRSGERVLLLRADTSDRGLVGRLARRGFKIEEAAIYRTVRGRGSNQSIGDANLIVFASPSAVRGFCELVDSNELGRLKRLKTLCIGPVTESAARENGFLDTATPETYTLDAVVDEIRRLTGIHA
jgi:uroporphyrinogen III methyltransferase/synthase